ncbi:MAG: lanthionine synthetase C family protein [Thiohalospira sp.]
MNEWNLSNKNCFLENKIEKIYNLLFYKNSKNIGLLGGGSGIALFYFYYGLYERRDESISKGFEVFENIFNTINKGDFNYSFSQGLAGFCWFADHLLQEGFFYEKLNFNLDSLLPHLKEVMLQFLKKGNFDYIHGASGIALYFLSRKKMPETKDYLAEYVDLLDKIGDKEGCKYKWLSNIARDERKFVYNLCLSHGISSLIIILSKIYSLGINQEKSFQLLNGAVNYLLANEQDFYTVGSHFPNWISKNSNTQKSRLAWCYGDLGIGIALWLAGKNANNSEWQNKALEILLHCTQRKDLEENFVVDAGLCHGTAGIAHIYNRMYNYTKREEFKQAALYWFDQTFKMAKFEDGLAGYKTWRSVEYGGWQNDYGLLTGIAGIGLALISAVSDIEPTWDECLLLS